MKRNEPNVHDNASGIFHGGLGPSQAKAFAKIISGKSVFLTGPAGSGKSELLKRVVSYWTHRRRQFAVTATTGLAAVSIKGRTLHSFFWLRTEDDLPEITCETIMERILQKPQAFKWYKKTMNTIQSLIIDEISMLSSELFIKISNILKVLRTSSKPFGGIQLILVGDFFQLPPVKSRFLFECPLFQECLDDSIILTEVYRQKDTAFVELLSRMRNGSCTPDDINVLQSRVGVDIQRHGIMPTELYATNKDVDQLNADRLSQIATEIVIFKVRPGMQGSSGPGQSDKLLKFIKDISAQDCILKAPDYAVGDEPTAEKNGVQVMLSFNLKQERGLVNGSRGVVIGFEEPCARVWQHSSVFTDFDPDEPTQSKAYIKGLKHPMVRFMVDNEPVEILVPYVRYERQEKGFLLYAWVMPLKLAWATTVHKSQGQSLDLVRASIDSSVFADGQAYVAISRARTLAGLSLKNFDSSAIRASEKVKQFYEKMFSL